MIVQKLIDRLNSIRRQSETVYKTLTNMSVTDCVEVISRVDEQLIDSEIAEFKEQVMRSANSDK